jgi:exodeoxyribonuclease VII small subunit
LTNPNTFCKPCIKLVKTGHLTGFYKKNLEIGGFILYSFKRQKKGNLMEKETDQKSLDINSLPFEEALLQLQDLVKKMESGTTPLSDSVAAYEMGMKLKAYCEQVLKKAELKIEKMTPADE